MRRQKDAPGLKNKQCSAGLHIQLKHDARRDYQALIHVAFRARGKTSILIDATVEQAISTCSAKINVTAPQVLNRIWNLKVPTFGGDYCWRNDSFPFSGTFRIRDRQLELYRLLAILFDFNALAL